MSSLLPGLVVEQPSEIEAAIQAALDRQSLRYLEIVFYIAGGVTALFSCFFLIHFTMFLVFGLNPHFFDQSANSHQGPPPTGIFLVGAAIMGVIILLGWTFGALQIFVGRCLKNRKHRLLILIVAGMECIFIPWGTALGIWTFLIMERPTVKMLFATRQS